MLLLLGNLNNPCLIMVNPFVYVAVHILGRVYYYSNNSYEKQHCMLHTVKENRLVIFVGKKNDIN